MKRALQCLMAMSAWGLAGAAVAGPTATLTIRYAGSTTSSLTAVQVTNGSGFSNNIFLAYAPPEFNSDLSYVHYYDVGLSFTPETYTNGVANETFRSAKINIVLSSALAFATPQGVLGSTAQKYFGFALTSDTTSSNVFGINSDTGIAGDVQEIHILQNEAMKSAMSQVGVGDITGFGLTWNGGKAIPVPTYFGRFGVKATGPLPIEPWMPVLAANGGEFSYFVNNNLHQAVFDNNSYVVDASGLIGTVPEPGTVGVLALGLGMLTQRKRGR